MRDIYTAPEMEIIEFAAEDVITASFLNGGEYDDFGGDGQIQIS